MPVLLAGGGFEHGQHLAFDQKRNYPLPNLFVSLLQQLGLETVVLGPGNIAQAHQPDEYLALDTLQPCISALRQLIQRFCLPASS